jgi:hypothetical protein
MANANSVGSTKDTSKPLNYAHVVRKPPVVGTKEKSQSSFKASSQPKEFHVHLGNLELGTSHSMILDYVKEGNIPLRILSCEMVHSTRTTKPRSVSAHVVIDAIDKEKVFNPDYWPESVTVRPWRNKSNTAKLGFRREEDYPGWD